MSEATSSSCSLQVSRHVFSVEGTADSVARPAWLRLRAITIERGLYQTYSGGSTGYYVKWRFVLLGGIFDFHATNRRQGGFWSSSSFFASLRPLRNSRDRNEASPPLSPLLYGRRLAGDVGRLGCAAKRNVAKRDSFRVRFACFGENVTYIFSLPTFFFSLRFASVFFFSLRFASVFFFRFRLFLFVSFHFRILLFASVFFCSLRFATLFFFPLPNFSFPFVLASVFFFSLLPFFVSLQSKNR